MIEKIDFYQLNLPLTEPYHLSFREVRHFDTFIAVIHEGGRMGIGETTPLPGYCDETPEQAWAFGQEIGLGIIGKGLEEAREALNAHVKKAPFSVTPFLTALETLEGQKDFIFRDVELVGILSTGDHGEIVRQFPEIVGRGFKTVKVKVGNNVEADIAKVNLIQSLRPKDVAIRVDANQGYDYSQAARFVREVEPEGIELFEQPFPKGVWDEMKSLSEISPIPLMLDESINTWEDLARTIELKCASYVKFKLMKAGSLDNLAGLVKTAREAGLEVVLGNGVAGEIGCWHEALAAARVALANAGEMNGFLKIKESVLQNPLSFKAGRIKGEDGFAPKLDLLKVKKYLIREYAWEK